MVRINLIEPSKLADQHLIAEYREILLLFGYYRKHPIIRPSDNHKQPMRFYQDKLWYLVKRFIQLKVEMIVRGFKPTKTIGYKELKVKDEYQGRCNDFKPNDRQIQDIKDRITQRVYERPTWYRYYGQYKEPEFFVDLMKVT